MRTSSTLNTLSRMTTTAAATITTPPFTPPAKHSPWHSPMPYLFGGLAAMLGLIAFALLILACSYWKLSGRLNNSGERDIEAGGEEKMENSGKESMPVVLDEKIVVIMAGDLKPSFLATPMSSRASSFGTDGNNNNNNGKKEKEDRENVEEESEKPKEDRQNLHEETQENEEEETQEES